MDRSVGPLPQQFLESNQLPYNIRFTIQKFTVRGLWMGGALIPVSRMTLTLRPMTRTGAGTRSDSRPLPVRFHGQVQPNNG